MAPEPIDLHHLGRERVIASYLLDTDDGPSLFDCGPATTVDALKAGLAVRGLAPTRRRHVRFALGRARATAAGERPRGRRPRARARVVPHARTRLAPRLLPRPRRDAVGRRRVRRARAPRPFRPAAHAAARGGRRGVAADARRDRAPRSAAAGADPLRRGRGRRAARHRAGADARRLGRVGRGRGDGGGVRRVRARRARRLGRGRRLVRAGDAVLAVLPRARALGQEARALAYRLVARHDPGVQGPLRLPAFRLLFAARAISYVGTYLAPIAVAFAVLDLGGGATAVGLSFAAWTLAQVAMLAFGGVVGDRVPRRVVMVGSDVASAFVRTAMGALLISGHAEVWHLIALQACGGAAVAFYSPASYGLTREVVPEDELQQANGLLAIARYAAFPLGGAIGGSIVVLVGTGAALLVDAGTYATSALLLSRIDVVSIAKAGAGFLRELREGWSAFVEQTWVWVLVLWFSFYFLITYASFFVLGPYVAKHSMDGRALVDF